MKYPAGTYGFQDQAIQSKVILPGSYEQLYVSYRVRFDDGFDFVRGGKLPGLIGGAGNTPVATGRMAATARAGG